MKILGKSIFLLFILSFSACSNPVKEFEINDDVQHITLKLYADSTFIAEVEEIEDSYEYSGIWSGNPSEGSTFTTTTTKRGFQIMTLTPKNEYLIKNGSLIKLNETQYTKGILCKTT